MNHHFIKEIIDLAAEFEKGNTTNSNYSVNDFKNWVVNHHQTTHEESYWEGKENGRSLESVINTLIIHMNRYAKLYSKAAIFGSDFSTQEDFIYLINLKAFGEMTKMDLIKKNVHEKPTGMQIINRLIAQGWIDQKNSDSDKRSKVIKISNSGNIALENQMSKIRTASEIVTGNLTQNEKLELIRLLTKLNDFHQPIYEKNIEPENLLDEVIKIIK